MTQHHPRPPNVCKLINSNASFLKQDLEEKYAIDLKPELESFIEEVVPVTNYDASYYNEPDAVQLIAIKLLFNDYVQFRRGEHGAVQINDASIITLMSHFERNWKQYLPLGWESAMSEDIARSGYTIKYSDSNFSKFLNLYGSCWRRDYKKIYSISTVWAYGLKITNWSPYSNAAKQSSNIRKAQEEQSNPKYSIFKLNNPNLLFKGSDVLEKAISHLTPYNLTTGHLESNIEDKLDVIYSKWPDVTIDKYGKKLKTAWWPHYLRLSNETEVGTLGKNSVHLPLVAISSYLTTFHSIEKKISLQFEAMLLNGQMNQQLLHIGENYSKGNKRIGLKNYILKTPSDFLWGDFPDPIDLSNDTWYKCLIGSSARILELHLYHHHSALETVSKIETIKREYGKSTGNVNYFQWLCQQRGWTLPDAMSAALLNMKSESMRRSLDRNLFRENIMPMFISIAIAEYGSESLKRSHLAQLFCVYNGGINSLDHVASRFDITKEAAATKLFSIQSFTTILDTIFHLKHDDDSNLWAP